jgi:hypothetical protein
VSVSIHVQYYQHPDDSTPLYPPTAVPGIDPAEAWRFRDAAAVVGAGRSFFDVVFTSRESEPLFVRPTECGFTGSDDDLGVANESAG